MTYARRYRWALYGYDGRTFGRTALVKRYRSKWRARLGRWWLIRVRAWEAAWIKAEHVLVNGDVTPADDWTEIT